MITDDEILGLFAKNDPCARGDVPAATHRLDADEIKQRDATRVDLDELDPSRSDGGTHGRWWRPLVAAAAVVVPVVATLTWVARDDTGSGSPTGSAPDSPNAVVVASGVLDALARRDAVDAESHLASLPGLPLFLPERVASADPSVYDLRSEIEWQKATGFELVVGSCEVIRVVDDETTVRCPYGVHWLWSAEMGLGPYGGNELDIVVREGRVVRIWNLTGLERDGFYDQWWRPFADWVASTHPDDHDTLYVDADATWARYTDEAIRLWASLGEQYASPQTRIGAVGLPPASSQPSPLTGATLSEQHWCDQDRTTMKFGDQCSSVLVYPNGMLLWRYHGNIPEGANPVSTGWLEQHLSPAGVELFRQGFDWPDDPAEMAARLRDPASWPSGTWDDHQIRSFVSSRYYVCFGPIDAAADVGPQLLDNLPAAARDLAGQWEWWENHHMKPAFFVYCTDLTTHEAREFANELDRAGIATTPVANAYALDYHFDDGSEPSGIRLNFSPWTDADG